MQSKEASYLDRVGRVVVQDGFDLEIDIVIVDWAHLAQRIAHSSLVT